MMSVEAGTTQVRCRISHAEAVAPGLRLLRLTPEEGGALFSWRAGQYASFSMDGFEARAFSIANAPNPECIELHIRGSGRGGLGDALCHDADVGSVVDVEGPFGAAYWRDRHDGPLLAIAGGTGLAPMKAICEAALASDLKRDVHLYAGVRTETEIYLERYFIDLQKRHANFRYVCVVTEPQDPGSGRRRGLVGDAVAADFPLLYGYQCYLAGPQVMVDACRTMLKLKGVPPHDMFCDLMYGGATP